VRPTGSKLDPTEAELWSPQSAAWESGTYALNVTGADAADLAEGHRPATAPCRGSPRITAIRASAM
jgi:hypothetical protein